MNEIYVCLENIRSLYNVGAILRTCSFFGIKNVILLGYSGVKRDKEGVPHIHEKVSKTALGSEEDVNIIFVEDTESLKKFAMDKNLTITSFEQTSESKNFNIWKPRGNQILVFGNEATGVTNSLLDVSNEVVEIKRRGKHNSLNVEVTFAIVCTKICE